MFKKSIEKALKAATSKLSVSATPKTETKAKFNASGNLFHYVNDPTTTDLVDQVSYTSITSRTAAVPLKFAVKDYNGGGYTFNTVQGKSANVQVIATRTLEWFKTNQATPLITKWAAVPILRYYPLAGQDLNAYYDRTAVRLFYLDKCFAASSTDIVAHETGHGLLDACRPDTWSVQSIELWAFHEAFADFVALMVAFNHPKMISKSLSQTKNNLALSNVVSKVAEEFGKAIYVATGGRGGYNPNYLRDAVNSYKYIDPTTLPEDGNYNTITAECHSFSRIMTATLYDIFVMMYRGNINKSMTPTDSVIAARDTLSRYVIKAIRNVPVNPKFYEAFAQTLLWVDWSSTKEYHDRMWDIFVARNIISPVSALSSIKEKDIKGGITVEKNSNGTLVKTRNTHVGALSHHMPISALTTTNPLYNKEIDMAFEDLYIFDKNGDVISYVKASTETKIAAAKYCLDRLHATNSVSKSSKTPFEIKGNKIIRTHFECRCK